MKIPRKLVKEKEDLLRLYQNVEILSLQLENECCLSPEEVKLIRSLAMEKFIALNIQIEQMKKPTQVLKS